MRGAQGVVETAGDGLGAGHDGPRQADRGGQLEESSAERRVCGGTCGTFCQTWRVSGGGLRVVAGPVRAVIGGPNESPESRVKTLCVKALHY